MCARSLHSRTARSPSTFVGATGVRAWSRSPSTSERSDRVAAGEYPADLKYHRDHDWARIDGDEATLGITWYAQDSLGELVHYEPPEEGQTVTAGSPYGEVESVKAVSDVVAPLS